MKDKLPIGVFDSGVGGLSVLHHIRDCLPTEDLIYLADTSYAPYGKRPLSEIRDRCMLICQYFVQRKAKAIVVACNTATAAAIELLRSHFDIPIIGMEPGLKPALNSTQSGKVAVLATDNTLSSEKFELLIRRFRTHQEVIIQPFTELVSLIENGDLSSKAITHSLTEVIPPLVTQGIDTLVLGCSHYPLIIDQIRDVAGEKVHVIDTGEAVAKELRRRLVEIDMNEKDTTPGFTELLTSSADPQSRKILASFFPEAEQTLSITLTTESV